MRTFISFPAETARMDFLKFTFYTLLGCVSWVFALTYLGFVLGSNWGVIGSYLHYLNYAVAVGLVAALAYLAYRWRFADNSSGSGGVK